MEEFMNNEDSMEMVAEEVAKLPVKGNSKNILAVGTGVVIGLMVYPVSRWIKKTWSEHKAKKAAKVCETELVEVVEDED